MKEGKSITQFPRQELLTGDELFLVNQKQNDDTYVSRYMSLSTLRDYILGYTPIPTESGGIIIEIPESPDNPDVGTIYEFKTAGTDYTKNLSAGTWKYTIVGGGGNFYFYRPFEWMVGGTRLNNVSSGMSLLELRRIYGNQVRQNYLTTRAKYYQGGSSPMIIGTFTLSEPTQCKFHVGNRGSFVQYEDTALTLSKSTVVPKDDDEHSYVKGGDPSFIAKGDINASLSEENKVNIIVATKAQKYYPQSSITNDGSWGKWEYNKDNPYLDNCTTLDDNCKNGTVGSNGYYVSGGGLSGTTIQQNYPSQKKTTGTNYGRSPGYTYYKLSIYDGTLEDDGIYCTAPEVEGWKIDYSYCGGYIKVEKIS